jgi:hypothetical protein
MERDQEQRLCPTLYPDCSRSGQLRARAAWRDFILLLGFAYCVGVSYSDFKADLYGVTALSISVARSAWAKTGPARIDDKSDFEMKNRKFASLHFRCRLILV